jgi:hypothetical protein
VKQKFFSHYILIYRGESFAETCGQKNWAQRNSGPNFIKAYFLEAFFFFLRPGRFLAAVVFFATFFDLTLRVAFLFGAFFFAELFFAFAMT